MKLPWFTELLVASETPTLVDGIWRCHPQDQDQFFADYLPPAFLQDLEQAPMLGWRAAVERGLPRLSPYVAEYTRDYFFSSYRSDFVEDLRLVPGATVLDVGCGWGFASQRCLDKGALVVGTETAVQRLRFCATRFSQQGYSDRFVAVELDANRLFPFHSGAFDAIIVSGVLEWLPTSAPGRPEQVQDRFMDQCYQMLKPGGRLYLAIENRFWARYFLGASDLHTRQRFTSVLPRPLANAYSHWTSGKDYRAYTYSLAGYLRLFQRHGFATLSASFPRPDYVQPRHVQRLATDLPLSRPWYRLWAQVVAQRARWRPALVGRSFTFVARKP